jgi:hypothetical protein
MPAGQRLVHFVGIHGNPHIYDIEEVARYNIPEYDRLGQISCGFGH